MHPYDNEAATHCIAHFLRNDLESIIEENKAEIGAFEKIISNRLFDIDLNHGKPQPKKDRKLLNGLNSSEHLDILENLLIIMYKIRCNIFHAEKGFNYEQMLILEPANSCLKKLVDKLIVKVVDYC